MTPAAWEKELAPFRDLEAPGVAAVLLAEDLDALRLVAAWQAMGPTLAASWTRPKGPKPKTLLERWAWFWTGNVEAGEEWRRGFEPFADACGLRTQDAAARLVGLANARLIYPDGTISEWAYRLLDRQAERLFPELREAPEE